MENSDKNFDQGEAQPKPSETHTSENKLKLSFNATQFAQANEIAVRQGAIRDARANRIEIRQGGIAKSNTDQLVLQEGAIGISQSKSAQITASRIGGMLIQGAATVDQSAARVVAAGGDVSLDQSLIGLTVARNARVQNSGVFLLLAQHVDGDVKPVFGPRESIFFGAAAGISIAIMILLSKLIRIPIKLIQRRVSS
jgi:hypothetical protein